MQGISKSKHEHLIEALLQLERLLELNVDGNGVDNPFDCAVENENAVISKAAIEARIELVEIFESYNVTLEALSALIERYEVLYNYTRMEYVSKRLKELKRKITPSSIQFELLKDSIHTVYGT